MKTNDAIKITNEYVCMQYYTKKNQKEKIINVLKMIFLHQFDRKNIYIYLNFTLFHFLRNLRYLLTKKKEGSQQP